jgi:hypothetical protein
MNVKSIKCAKMITIIFVIINEKFVALKAALPFKTKGSHPQLEGHFRGRVHSGPRGKGSGATRGLGISSANRPI